MSKKNRQNRFEEKAQDEEVTESEPSVDNQETEIQVEPANEIAEVEVQTAAETPTSVSPAQPATLATRGVLPDAFGNNIKGNRICSVCGIKESETLAKNPRYSFCKGKCVNCYGKTERKQQLKPEDLTVDQLKAKIAYYEGLLANRNGAQGLSEVSAIASPVESTVETTIETHGASVDTQDESPAID